MPGEEPKNTHHHFSGRRTRLSTSTSTFSSRDIAKATQSTSTLSSRDIAKATQSTSTFSSRDIAKATQSTSTLSSRDIAKATQSTSISDPTRHLSGHRTRWSTSNSTSTWSSRDVAQATFTSTSSISDPGLLHRKRKLFAIENRAARDPIARSNVSPYHDREQLGFMAQSQPPHPSSSGPTYTPVLQTIRYASLAVAAYVERFGGSGDFDPLIAPARAVAATTSIGDADRGMALAAAGESRERARDEPRTSEQRSASLKNGSDNSDSDSSAVSQASHAGGRSRETDMRTKLPAIPPPLEKAPHDAGLAQRPPSASTRTVGHTSENSDAAKLAEWQELDNPASELELYNEDVQPDDDCACSIDATSTLEARALKRVRRELDSERELSQDRHHPMVNVSYINPPAEHMLRTMAYHLSADTDRESSTLPSAVREAAMQRCAPLLTNRF